MNMATHASKSKITIAAVNHFNMRFITFMFTSLLASGWLLLYGYYYLAPGVTLLQILKRLLYVAQGLIGSVDDGCNLS